MVISCEFSGLENLMDLFVTDPVDEKLLLTPLRPRDEVMLVGGGPLHQEAPAERAVKSLLG
ncbi:MAG: hypothetical protein RLY30_1918 [Pseudomonadota bacterium]